jgi:signal transduction histidine kinase/ActR/RegA family two-component response regulator
MKSKRTQDALDRSAAPTAGPARIVLDFAYRLLAPTPGLSPETLLSELARVTGSKRAGFAGVFNKTVVLSFRSSVSQSDDKPRSYPWQEWPNLLTELYTLTSAEIRQWHNGQICVLAVSPYRDGVVWMLWLERTAEPAFEADEASALVLAAGAFGRMILQHPDSKRWDSWLTRARRQQRLDDAGQVAARVAHDFNNVLAGIMGFTELSLTQLPPDVPGRSLVSEVYEASLQGNRLVKQLSSFARRGKISSQPYRLADTIGSVKTRVQGTAGKKIEFLADLPPNLPVLAVDAEALQAILNHLVDNAIEAIGPSGKVSLSARVVDLTSVDCLGLLGTCLAGRHAEIRIADTGAGFSPAARERVLAQPFFTDKHRHRGLGLATVYGLLCAYNGGLCFEHGAGAGTTVCFFVPLSAGSAQQPAARLSAPSAVHGKPRAERVLVVDDDPMTLSYMCTTLEQAGYQVYSAIDGVSALDSFDTAKEPFRLVLSDVVMPHMTGFELAQQLLDRNPALPILFTSGHVPPGCVPESFSGGSYDFLAKPFPPDSLLKAVQTALARDLGKPKETAAFSPTEKIPSP